MSHNMAFSMPETWGGENCLSPVNISVIWEIKKEMGGNELLKFVSREFSDYTEAAYTMLHIEKLTFDNVWVVFQKLLPLIFPRPLNI